VESRFHCVWQLAELHDRPMLTVNTVLVALV
jgi:hypothetical protein